MNFLKLCIIILLPLNTILAASISFTAGQEAEHVYFGGHLRAILSLETNEKLDAGLNPRIINASNNYSIKIAPEPRVSQSSFVQIINGERTTKSDYTYQWPMVINPNSTNTIEAIKFEIDVNGKSYSAQLEPITVIAPQPSPIASIDFSADKTEVIAEDTFRITASIRMVAITNATNKLPPIYQRATPTLLLPHLDQNQEEIKLVANGVNQLFEHATSNIGLYINDYRIQSPFSIFANNSQSIFNLPNTITEENGTNYFVYSWTTIYKAKTPSTITFKPITLVGQLLKERLDGRFDLEDVFIVSDPITITISEPPLEGRPKCFIGAISDKLKAETSLDTQNCKEGDPITLTLKLENVENPLSVLPPNLNELDGFADKFRAFGETKATPNEAEKKAVFEYSLRPITSGTIEFPAIELGYYNLSTNQYATITTIPVPIRVDPAPQVAAFGDDANSGDSITSDITRYYPTAISLDFVANEPLTSPNSKLVKLAIFAPFIWISAVIFRFIYRRRKQIIERIQNVSATSKAIKDLNDSQTPQDIMGAVSSLIKHGFKTKTSSFTPNDIVKLLQEHNVDSEIVNELSTTLNRVFNLSFAPSADISSEVSMAKEKLIPPLQKLKGKNKSIPQACLLFVFAIVSVALLVLPIFIAIVFASNVPNQETNIQEKSFDNYYKHRQATFLMNTAVTKDDFTTIATNYYGEFSLKAGENNNAIVHNYATALTLAGYPKLALQTLRHLETRTGSTKEIENSMLFALQTLQESEQEDNSNTIITESPTLPWYRIPLFWHFKYSLIERINIVACFWTGIWALLSIRLFTQRRKIINILLAICSFLFILFFSSYFISSSLIKPLPPIPDEDINLENELSIEEVQTYE